MIQTQVDTQLPVEQTTVTAEPGSEDEAISAFNQRATSKAPEATETVTDEPPEEATEEAQSDPEEADPAEQLIELEYEGKTYKVQPGLKDAVLRKQDYSRVMQEVSSAKKDYTQRIESATKLYEGAEKYAKALAEVQLHEQTLEQFKTVDFDKLEIEDPARASILAVKLIRAQNARDQAVTKAKAIDTELADGRAKDVQAKQVDMFKTLQKDFAGWGEEAGTRVTQYALKTGWSADELRGLTDPKVVIALEKARKFDAIQDGKAAALSKAKDAPPVAKPGAPRRVDAQQDTKARFMKSNSPEDAEALFHARASARR